jgi:hypothetical protein
MCVCWGGGGRSSATACWARGGGEGVAEHHVCGTMLMIISLCKLTQTTVGLCWGSERDGGIDVCSMLCTWQGLMGQRGEVSF